jgi:hypothetical protein
MNVSTHSYGDITLNIGNIDLKCISLKLKETKKLKNKDADLKAFLLGIAPHLFVVLGQAVDAVHHDEGEVPVVNLLLERLDQTGSVGIFQFRLIFILF